MKNILLTSVICAVLTLAGFGQGPMSGVEPYSVKEVFQAVVRTGPRFQKDEYEKEADYVARLKKLDAETPVSTLPTGDRRTLDGAVFVFHNLASYDAETEHFNFDIHKIFHTSLMTSAATGKIDIELTPAYLVNGRWIGDASNVLTLTPPRILMSPDKAREAAPTLALAIYAMPVAADMDGYRLLVIPTRMVAYNTVTGEIYAESRGK